MKRLLILAISPLVLGDTGVLIPSTLRQPDAKVLSLDEMSIDVVIDNGYAKVNIRQIFGNHTAKLLEGNYVFALPGAALVSDFAVWDDTTRIPGVILERKRAEEMYREIRLQALDPGLLQMGERDADEARRTSIFSARIVPIPAYGTKRLEIEYQERLSVEQAEAFFSIPLQAGCLSRANSRAADHPREREERARHARFSVRQQSVSDENERADGEIGRSLV